MSSKLTYTDEGGTTWTVPEGNVLNEMEQGLIRARGQLDQNGWHELSWSAQGPAEVVMLVHNGRVTHSARV